MTPKQILTPYRKSRAFHAAVPVTCFDGEHVFRTRQGDCGVALRVTAVDDECLMEATREALSHTLLSAFKVFPEHMRLYQYLTKRASCDLPRKDIYPDSKVQQIVQDRLAHLEQNAALGTIELTFVVLYETSFGSRRPARRKRMSAGAMREELNSARETLLATVDSFRARVAPPFSLRLLTKRETFRFLRTLLNLDPAKATAISLRRDTHLDYAAVASRLDWNEKGRLRLDDRLLTVLSLKELPKYTTPNLFRQLAAIDCDLILCSEWVRRENPQLRKAVTEKRRYLWNFKRHSAGTMLAAATNKQAAFEPDPDLEDDSARVLIRNLKDALRRIETEGGYFGQFSFTILLHGTESKRLAAASAEVSRILSDFEAEAIEESYGALSAYLAMLPGNSKLNVRRQWLQNSHYADLSFFYAPDTGSLKASELDDEYLTVFETRQGTPFFFDPYVNHSLGISIFGPRGTGKSVLANVLLSQAQKYGGYSFVLDLGGSFDANARYFGGTVLKLSLAAQSFRINPFSLEPTPDNLEFVSSFVKLLMQTDGDPAWTYKEDQLLYQTIRGMYTAYAGTPQLRLQTLARLLPPALTGRLAKWIGGGQYGVLFDHPEDTLTLSRFVVFDMQGVDEYRDIVEPLLYWILRRIKSVVHDPAQTGTFKLLVLDELWKHLQSPKVVEFANLMVKTGRKHLVGTILATQSVGDLGPQTELFLDNCKMQFFLPNANFDRAQYERLFQLSTKEMELIAGLQPRELLLKTPDYAKVLRLTIDPQSYWRFTTSAREVEQRARAVTAYGSEEAIRRLAAGQS
jgi:type IV secretion system protein VirB4